MCVFSPLPPLCCRFIPGPNRELPLQGCMPRSSPHLPFLFPLNGLKTITSMATDWITWDHRKDIHPDKTALLVWCQGFETRLIPCLINEPHVGDSPLPHSCGQFSTHSLSLCFPHSVSPLKNWNSLAGVIYRLLKHYLKTFEGKPVEEITRTWTWDQEDWEREIMLSFLSGRLCLAVSAGCLSCDYTEIIKLKSIGLFSDCINWHPSRS